MRVPILKQGAVLIASIQSSLSDADLRDLKDELILRVGTDRAHGVLIDVAALDVIDSFATRMISALAQMVRLRGARTVIVGIQPEVAESMVTLGLDLDHVLTALDLEHGLELLRSELEGGSAHG